MHDKRDRSVQLYLHRTSKRVLLFPFVWFMAGRGAWFGDAEELPAPLNLALLGERTAALLQICREADVDAIKETIETRSAPKSWTKLKSKYPVLVKGPGTYLRQYNVCNVFERDGI